MKISEHWLREWVNPSLTTKLLADKLTMSGLEVEAISPVAEKFSNVMIGQLLRVEQHPAADHLQVCLVDVGQGMHLTIVCGAMNVYENMKAPVAIEAAVLPNKNITKTDIQGVNSQGMLCSLKDMGLAEESDGLYELPFDAPVGVDVWEYLKLSDRVLDISITPNRGDCLSIRGLAKEISALTQSAVTEVEVKKNKQILADTFPIEVKVTRECPRYVGRIIRGVRADVMTPVWMQERLRRSGERSISPIVDVMNYVMLELGQPMHAFDLSKIEGVIAVRKAYENEELLLLDGSTASLNPEVMVIADQHKPLAIAGVMGGFESGVSLLTEDIFLESAYFNPISISKTARAYDLTSESSYRFERGIDPTLQAFALERATQLILEITGGKPGPVIEVTAEEYLPKETIIVLHQEKINKLLGLSFSENEIESLLKRMGCNLKKISTGFSVTAPARRSDILLDVDLIEEIIRLHGYEKIPLHSSLVPLVASKQSERSLSLKRLRHTLIDLGYQEAVTYSFIDPKHQQLIDPHQQSKSLLNPMSSEMAVMRTSLWPGLINTLVYNQNRQQLRARLFETGLRFIIEEGELKQEPVISGLVNGEVFPLQWGIASRAADFFDLKGDVLNLFKLSHAESEFYFKPITHPALHPGQTAAVYRKDQLVGLMGALHPSLSKQLDIIGKTCLFEFLLEPLLSANLPQAHEVSRFPEIRRDLAILVDKTIPYASIRDTIIKVAGGFLQEVTIFDIYEGKGISPERKSLAIALTLRHPSRTLIDEDVVKLMDCVITALKNKFAAELRG
jgi:phenylalanyl-tRNA synthetase beta chain